MDEFFGPHFDTDLIGVNGKLSRLHKGGSKPKPVQSVPAPVARGKIATSIAEVKKNTPRIRAFGRTVLSTGMDTGFGGSTILGG